MNIHNIIITVILLATIVSCTHDEKKYKKSHHTINEIRDTINVIDIRNEFNKRLHSTGEGVKLHFFDKNNLPVGGLNKGDTFFIVIDYYSDTFVDLAKNHTIELKRAKGSFDIIDKLPKNKFKLAIGAKADTIEFDVFMKSNKYIFNDYYMNNGEIKYQLTDKIGLCRLTELPL